MSETAQPTTPTRKLTLDKRVKNTVDDSRIVKSKRGPQEHILPVETTRTLCGIDTQAWTEVVVVDSKSTNCPVCARVMKERPAKQLASVAD